MNVHPSQGSSELDEQNSCVVLDMPMDSSAILPFALGFPFSSSGCTLSARERPAESCATGGVLAQSGYSPPVNPRYVRSTRSVSGTRPVAAPTVVHRGASTLVEGATSEHAVAYARPAQHRSDRFMRNLTK